MKAILVNDDRSLRWDDAPNPEIKPEEVLVEIHAVLPITEAEAAHDILYQGKNVGKVVLTVK